MSDALPVRAAYQSWAAIYDDNVNATRDMDAAVLRGAGLELEGRRIVELGAGTGKNTVFLAEHAAEVVALDLSPAMLERARRRVASANVRFVEHDITRPWPVPSDWADLVVGNLVLEHIGDLAPVFVEAYRVLKPGGLLYACELHPYRQRRGAQAQFDPGDGTRRVEAYTHSVSDFVNTGLAAGFTLRQLSEHADADGMPRLLAMLFST